jgi:hypothetical protein
MHEHSPGRSPREKDQSKGKTKPKTDHAKEGMRQAGKSVKERLT